VSKTAGVVGQVYVQEGRTVKAGELLMKVE